jgi:hypothetical protein
VEPGTRREPRTTTEYLVIVALGAALAVGIVALLIGLTGWRLDFGIVALLSCPLAVFAALRLEGDWVHDATSLGRLPAVALTGFVTAWMWG